MLYQYTYYWNDAKDEAGHWLGFFGYEPGHKLVVAYRGQVKAPTIPDALDKLYQIFNTEYRPASYRGPSMSVGSVIGIGEGFYACAPVGWLEVDAKDSTFAPCDRRWWIGPSTQRTPPEVFIG